VPARVWFRFIICAEAVAASAAKDRSLDCMMIDVCKIVEHRENVLGTMRRVIVEGEKGGKGGI